MKALFTKVNVTPGLTLELAYRYLDLGSAATGSSNSVDGVTVVNGSPFGLRDITSHDFMLGVRWMLNEPAAMPAPVVRKG